MPLQRLVPAGTLAAILQIEPRSMAPMRRAGLFQSDHRRCMREPKEIEMDLSNPDVPNSDAPNAIHFYTLRTINDIFAAPGVAKNFNGRPLPTARELLSGKERLLTIQQVSDLLGKDDHTILRIFIGTGKLAALRISHNILRVPASAAVELQQKLESKEKSAIPKNEAALILGVNPNTIKIWTRDPNSPLEKEEVEGDARNLYVSYESLRAALTEYTGGRVTVDDWLKLRFRHRDALLSANQLDKLCDVPNGASRARLDASNIPFIVIPNNRVRVPTWAVQAWINEAAGELGDTSKPLTTTELTSIFGTERANTLWRTEHCRSAGCKWPGEHPPRRSCVRRYIEQHRVSEAVNPDVWIDAAVRDATPRFIASGDVRDGWKGFSLAELLEVAIERQFYAVWLPFKEKQVELVFKSEDFYSLVRALRQRERKTFTSYHRSYADFLE